MMRKQIILWGGWYGSNNVGDQSLLLAITDLLGSVYPDTRFIVLSANPAHVHSYTSRDSKFDICAINTRREFPHVVRAFMESDLFIFGGGVPFFDHAPQVLAMVVLTTLARFFHVPYFLWSVSSQRVDSELTKKTFGWVLRGACGVTSRDEFTRKLFLDCGLPADKMTIGGDSVILMHTDPADSVLDLLERTGWQMGNRPLVALTPRTLRTADGEAETHYTLIKQNELQKEIDTYAAVLDWLWEHSYQPIFVPMNTVAPDDDRLASRMIMSKARHGNFALMIDEEINPRAAAAIYQHCRASLVSRVHAGIMSFKAKRPMVMYAFDQKHIGIMQEMGLSDTIFYPGKHNADFAVEIMAKILRNEEDTRFSLAGNMEISSEKSMLPFRQVLKILDRK